MNNWFEVIENEIKKKKKNHGNQIFRFVGN
jgi:hypothetical protein